ncbi:MAG: alpha/beta fold hydrolase [Muribaculaceae bacterium]|nr:alpha/beta fold hydrolase [Muribaculaceae bacterium]
MKRLNLFLILFLFISYLGLGANTSFSIPELPAASGQRIQIPITVEGEEEFTAFQLDINVDDRIQLDSNVELSNRCADHLATVRKIGKGVYRIMCYSPTNELFRGTAGTLVSLQGNVGQSCLQGEEYPVNITNLTVTGPNTEVITSETRDGKIIITHSPDLGVDNVRFSLEKISPKDNLECYWRVCNYGTLSSKTGFREYIYLISEDGKIQKLLANSFFNSILDVGEEIGRSMIVRIPEITGMDGKCRIMVKLEPFSDSGESESMASNNKAISEQSIYVEKELYISPSSVIIDEKSTSKIKLTISRSGSTEEAEVFKVVCEPADSRLILPESITIPKDVESINLEADVSANGFQDNNHRVQISLTGNGYASVTSQISLKDDCPADMQVSLSKESVIEGESFDLTVTLPYRSSYDEEIIISTDKPKKLLVPDSLIIPAGERTGKVTIQTIDNNQAELDVEATLRIICENTEKVERYITIEDDDIPSLSLDISSSVVSENAGTNALLATVTRLNNFDKEVKLKIMDSSDDDFLYSSNIINMRKGEKSAMFMIGIRDNDLVDGDRTYDVTVAIYSSSCNCYGSELTGGSVTKQITVTDDDVPHIKIGSSAKAFIEGSTNNILTISRNTISNEDLLVSISSDKDEKIDYPKTAVIPAGNKSVEVMINIPSDDKTLDGDIVCFNAEADGMTAGTCWIIITDTTLPDADLEMVVYPISKEDTFVAGDNAGIKLKVNNRGNAVLPSRIPIEIKYTGSKEVRTVYTSTDIECGESETIIIEDLVLPNSLGTTAISAEVNPNHKVSELLYTNNETPKINVELAPAFHAYARMEKEKYFQNDIILITGGTDNDRGKTADVELRLENDGDIYKTVVKSDENGNFALEYPLMSAQVGTINVTACYPGDNSAQSTYSFMVHGLRTDEARNIVELGIGESTTLLLQISNPCKITQKGLKIEPLSKSNACNISVKCPSVIESGKTIIASIKIEGQAQTEGKEYEKIPFAITTEDGANVAYTLYSFITPQHCKLEVEDSFIETTLNINESREYPLKIRNIGKCETGPVTFLLPEWMEVVSPKKIDSLKMGESASVILRFNPDDEMQLNVARKGHFSINCRNGNGVQVSYEITPVSESMGKILLDVVDEYTFYTDERPHVAGAKISIIHPTTKKLIAEGLTDSKGQFKVNIHEGWYEFKIEADNHTICLDNLMVSPGQEFQKEIFLSAEAVTYSFDVKETEIVDEYIIETVAKFDTRVPKPLLEVSLPETRPKLYELIPVCVSNIGYISAADVYPSIAANSEYRFEWINEPFVQRIGAGETVVFYARLLPKESNEVNDLRASKLSEGCLRIYSKVSYKHLCDKYIQEELALRNKNYGCGSTSDYAVDFNSFGDGGSIGVGSPSLWQPLSSGASSYQEMPVTIPNKFCDSTSARNTESDEEDPVDLEVLEDNDYKFQICEKEPILKYCLVPMDGRKYKLNGVTADGKAQLRIALDPSSSLLPNDDCSKVMFAYWNLSPNIGKIEGNNIIEAIYSAPEYFDPEVAVNGLNQTYTYATCIYQVQTEDGEYHTYQSEPICIEVYPPSVMFVHGLGSNDECWQDLADRMETELYYKDSLIHRVDYRTTNTERFSVNIHEIPDGLKRLRRKALDLGIIIGKSDVIGHSMGGVLARLYAQSEDYKDDINRLITVNTPHSGSEIGDMVTAHFQLLAKSFFSITNGAKKSDIGAVNDLGVNSSATMALNRRMSNPPEIPVFAFGTESIDAENVLATKLFTCSVDALLDVGVDFVSNILPPPISGILAYLAKFNLHNFGMMGFSEHFLGDYIQTCPGDMVVSTESQLGGCKATYLMEDGPWHVDSPKNEDVQDYLLRMIQDYSKSHFSKEWFHPQPRKFEDYILNYIKTSFLPTPLAFGINCSMAICEYENNKYIPHRNTNATVQPVVKETDTRKFRFLKVQVELPNGYSDPLTYISVGDKLVWYESQNFECIIPNSYKGSVIVTTIAKGEDGNAYYQTYDFTMDSYNAQPLRLEVEDLYMEIGELLNPIVKCYWDDGSFSDVIPDRIIFDDSKVAEFTEGMVRGLRKGKTQAKVFFETLSCDNTVKIYAPEINTPEDVSESICSTVTLSFNQAVAMTRQGFLGTFTVNNSHENAAIRNLKLNLEVTDEDGFRTTRREFEISPESLYGFRGELDFESGWTLDAKKTGSVEILFIPSKYAAPNSPQKYNFGGSFSYTDPFTGLIVTQELNPVTLTVKPAPVLDLTYFLQRDVLSDDPLTEDIIEKSEPVEFALVVTNTGNGDAKNLRLVTQQPVLKDNEKGLAISFEIESTQINGLEKSLSFGESVANDFGTVSAGKSVYAQWWLKSSMSGHFSDYNVSATHVSSYDNPNLSLLDNVTIHELIHGFTWNSGEENQLRCFLANDISDMEATPDQIYFSDGRDSEIVRAESSIQLTEIDLNTYQLTITPSSQGWIYGKIKDPSNGRLRIQSIKRMIDGIAIPVDNFWQTDRTLRDGQKPLYENLLHFITYVSGPESYFIEFSEKSDIQLGIDSFDLIYNEDSNDKYVKGIRVIFTKSIQPDTFTTDDVVLHHDGILMPSESFKIITESGYSFLVDMGISAAPAGNYSFSIYPSGIIDGEGYIGDKVRNIMWTQTQSAGGLIASKNLMVYPLPMRTNVRVCGDFSYAKELLIIDALGNIKFLKKGFVEGSEIDVSDWNQGLYIIRISLEDASHTIKVIKR